MDLVPLTFYERFARKHLSNGLAVALAQLRRELGILVQHRRSSRRARRLFDSRPVKLNCGCGRTPKQGWVNIDSRGNADLQLDLREKLPIPADSVSFIYSEHFFEHLEYPRETGVFLGESLRVLVPGGRFRVGVPDTEWPLRCYADGDEAYFTFVREHWHLFSDTRMHSINYHFRQMSEHKYAYDYETLAKLLVRAGFVSVRRSDFDPQLDSEHRRTGTLYLDAFKPSSAPIKAALP